MPTNDTAIVLTAFGTSTAARDTYAFFEARVRERFPDYDVLWAYTSHTLRAKMAREGRVWQSPHEILQELPLKGYKKAVLQSLHIVPGKEFEKIVAAAQQAPLPVAVGRPLLAGKHDCDAVLAALSGDIPDPAASITVVVGHGTPHAGAQNIYRLFQRCLTERYPHNVFLSMVEGDPSWDETVQAVRQSPIKNIKFLPLMFVAGDHIINDVLGDADSWAAQLAGYRLEARTKGLGFNGQVIKIYFQHLHEALNGV